MSTFLQVSALLAALIHVLFFCLESLWFMNPKVYLTFGMKNQTEAEVVRLLAFNQGFYNLFLAAGVFAGLYFGRSTEHKVVAETLVLFSCAAMFGAAVILLFSAGLKMLRGAIIQGLFPALAWAAWLLV